MESPALLRVDEKAAVGVKMTPNLTVCYHCIHVSLLRAWLRMQIVTALAINEIITTLF